MLQERQQHLPLRHAGSKGVGLRASLPGEVGPRGQGRPRTAIKNAFAFAEQMDAEEVDTTALPIAHSTSAVTTSCMQATEWQKELGLALARRHFKTQAQGAAPET